MPSFTERFFGKKPSPEEKQSSQPESIIRKITPLFTEAPTPTPVAPTRERNYQSRNFELRAHYFNVTQMESKATLKIIDQDKEKDFRLPRELFAQPGTTVLIEVQLPQQEEPTLVNVVLTKAGEMISRKLRWEEKVLADQKQIPVWKYEDIKSAFVEPEKKPKFFSSRRNNGLKK